MIGAVIERCVDVASQGIEVVRHVVDRVGMLSEVALQPGVVELLSSDIYGENGRDVWMHHETCQSAEN